MKSLFTRAMSDECKNLRKRREYLEACLQDKYSELTRLCITEAELTGKLPSETPFEPDGSLPEFRPILRSISLNSDEFYKIQKNDQKQVELISKKNGRVKDGTKKNRIRTIWETLPSINSKNSETLVMSSENTTWPNRRSPTKPNRSHPYFFSNKSKN